MKPRPKQTTPGNPGIVPGEQQRRRNISLSDRLAKIARDLGGGNVSEGIRLALEHHHVKGR